MIQMYFKVQKLGLLGKKEKEKQFITLLTMGILRKEQLNGSSWSFSTFVGTDRAFTWEIFETFHFQVLN